MWKHGKTSAATAILIFLLLAGAGCFFTPREPDEGSGVVEVCEPVQTADDMLERMPDAMEKFVSTGYQCLLSENNFVFNADVFDSTDLADRGIDVFTTPWTREDMIDAFELLITCFSDQNTRVGAMVLTYKGDMVVTDSTTTAQIYETDYELMIRSVTVATGVEDSVRLGGSLRWVVEDEGDSWRITRWDDFRKGESPTWGFFTGSAEGGVDFCPE